ncbi:MAG TPA: YidC/Oxa1 family membrane protein insertase, partial [Fimbriimonas sp.]
RQMSQLAPLTNEIKDKFKDNPQEQQARIMGLYKEYGINPMAGCGPMLLQMPLFFTIYQCMLLYQFEFQKGTFLWLNRSMSEQTNGFIAPNLGQVDYILIVLYGISMVISTLLTPVSDPTQIKQQRLIGVGMSVFFTILMFTGSFPVPAAFVLYWTFTNILATAQALRTYRLPAPPLVKVNAPGGGVYPTAGTSKWMQKLEELQRQAEAQNSARQGGSGGSSTRAKTNGPLSGTIIETHTKTGTPAKHKPKKRK